MGSYQIDVRKDVCDPHFRGGGVILKYIVPDEFEAGHGGLAQAVASG